MISRWDESPGIVPASKFAERAVYRQPGNKINGMNQLPQLHYCRF
ncbi:Uncharacterised protein [Legionella spiritensis]|nr:Uncharacterised protein [Legionella spiritensis]